jgi:hypothetical protein
MKKEKKIHVLWINNGDCGADLEKTVVAISKDKQKLETFEKENPLEKESYSIFTPFYFYTEEIIL